MAMKLICAEFEKRISGFRNYSIHCNIEVFYFCKNNVEENPNPVLSTQSPTDLQEARITLHLHCA